MSGSAHINMEMDSLAQTLENVKIEDWAPTESRSVTVPDGFPLALETTPIKFYKLKEEFKKHNKRKREQDFLSRSSIAKIRYGFVPEEVLSSALSLKDCKPSNLSNDIHPLLHHSRFDNCPDDIYDELRPGLRLATMFLTQPICSQFWLTLANGERKIDSHLTSVNGYKCERIENNVPMTKQNTANVIEYIKQFYKTNMIHWSFQHDLMIGSEHAYGVTKWHCDNHHELPRGQQDTHVRHHIRIHADMHTAASKLSKLRYPDTSQKLRFSFFVAILICHELAHAVESAHRTEDDHHREPWLFDHGIAELGRTWESITLGGTVHPINTAVDCSQGLGTWDWPDVGPDVVGERSFKYAVPMSYIENLFQMQTWQREYNLEDWRTFHIPRNGAKSFNMNSLTTMPWSEVVRVAREDSDLDEPAAKKREIATGEAVISSQRFEEELELMQEGPRTPPLMQTIKQQERIIRTHRTLSRKQRRNQKRAERDASDGRCAVSNTAGTQSTGMTAEDVKRTVNPEKPTKINGKGRKMDLEEGVCAEKDRPRLHAAEATEAIIWSRDHPSTTKKQASRAEQRIGTAPPALSKKRPSAENRAIISAEPVIAVAQSVDMPRKRNSSKANLYIKPKKPHPEITVKTIKPSPSSLQAMIVLKE